MNLSGRDEYILAKALFTAANVQAVGDKPPLSDIADMRRLLRKALPSQETLLILQDNIHRAMQLGMPMGVGHPCSSKDIQHWLDNNADQRSNVVRLPPRED